MLQFGVLTRPHPSSSSPSYWLLERLTGPDVPLIWSMTPRGPIRSLSSMVRRAHRQPALVSIDVGNGNLAVLPSS